MYEAPSPTAPEELLRRAATGDQTAFESLYQQMQSRVFHYLHRLLGDQSSAEDVLVETFTAVWKSAGQFGGRSAVSTWIFGIARNLAYNEMRKRRYHDDIDDHPDLAGGEIPDLTSKDRRRILDTAMAKLAPKHREVLDLAFLHEMTYPEIGELLDVPVGTVKTRVFHAKKALRSALTLMKVDRHDL